MKEINEGEKKLEMPSYSGDLKMVKVKKGKRGHRKSSLVFRISRTLSKPVSDDSGIKCSTSSEDEASSGSDEMSVKKEKLQWASGKHLKEETSESDETSVTKKQLICTTEVRHEKIKIEDCQESPPCPLKVKIPKSVLSNANKENELVVSDCDLSGDLTARNDDHNVSFLNDDIDDRIGDMDVDTIHTVSNAEESKSWEPRRSSRRILLRLQKDSPGESSMDMMPSVDFKIPAVSSHNYEQLAPAINERRKRGRKPGPQSDGKKRKYTRRGRPPKSFVSSNFSIVQPIFAAGSIENEKKKILFQAPKNSVWTLVPKDLFESEFFKSQVLKVRYSNPAEKSKASLPPAFTPSNALSPALAPNGRIQLKFPRVMVNTVPTAQQKASDDCKRPTVIYFKPEKKNFEEYPANRTELNLRPQFNSEKLTNVPNGLIYLFNKYRMLEEKLVRSCYELTRFDINETDCILSDLVSRNPIISSEKIANISDSQNNTTNGLAFDCRSNDTAPDHSETFDKSNSLPPIEVADTLSRHIIIESLEILYSEEAVLSSIR